MIFTKKDGWKTKGVKQLTRLNVQRACHLAEALEAQDVPYLIKLGCRTDHELETAKDAWAGFKQDDADTLSYKNVIVSKH